MRITIQPQTVTPLCPIGWTTSWLCLTDINRMQPGNAQRSILPETLLRSYKMRLQPHTILGIYSQPGACPLSCRRSSV